MLCCLFLIECLLLVAMTPLPPCLSSVKEKAHKFMQESYSAEWEDADLSPEGLDVLRQDNREAGLASWKAIEKEVNVEITQSSLGGVAVQLVTPKDELEGKEVILFLWGGAFVVGGPEDDLCITTRLAQYTGRKVVCPRYRLAPEHPFPAAQNDVRAVFDVLEKTGPVIVIGESAGGNLALSLALKQVKLVCCCLLSPWIDLSHSGDSHITLAKQDPTLSVKHFLHPAALAYAGERSLNDPEISPLFQTMPSCFPPVFVTTATRDLLMSDAVRLTSKLREAGNEKVDLRIEDGLWHVFEWYLIFFFVSFFFGF